VDIDQLHSGHGCGSQYGSGNGVWNIVEFQIKKDPRAPLRHLPHRFGPGGRKELAADLKHPDKVRHLVRKLQCGRQRIKVESYNQAAAWMRVEGRQGSGRARTD
jgi:hypothetical protein